MSNGKKSFIAYCDWIETFEELSNEEAGKLVKHLFKYVNDLAPESSDKLTKMCFIPIQQSLKRDLKKYDKYIDKQKVNGSKGGRPKKNPTEPKKPKPFLENPTEPKKADSVSVSVSDSVNVSDKEEKEIYSFGDFWSVYDKKVDVKKCKYRYSKLSPADQQKIKNTISDYVTANAEKQFRKNPLTYLNGECWKDEIEMQPQQKRYNPLDTIL